MKRYIIHFAILSAFVLIALFGATQKADAAISLVFGGGSYSSTGYGYGSPYYNNGYSSTGNSTMLGITASPNYYNNGYGNYYGNNYGGNYGYTSPINCYVYGYPCNNNTYYNNNNYYNNYSAVSPYYYGGGTNNYVNPVYNNYNNYNTSYVNPNMYAGGYYSSPNTMYGPRY